MLHLLPLAILASTVSAQVQTLQSVIQTYGLTAATFNYTAPTRALESDDAYDWIKENWDLTGNKIDYGINDMYVSIRESLYIQLTLSERSQPTQRRYRLHSFVGELHPPLHQLPPLDPKLPSRQLYRVKVQSFE